LNRKGENSFSLEDEKAKYEKGMEIFIKKKTGKVIFLNEHYITVQYQDGIKESFIWHELYEKYDPELLAEPEDEVDIDIDIEIE
jgi:hypothetical protein